MQGITYGLEKLHGVKCHNQTTSSLARGRHDQQDDRPDDIWDGEANHTIQCVVRLGDKPADVSIPSPFTPQRTP